MRLALFRSLSKAEQEKEVRKSKVKIQKAYQELCRIGTWYPPKTKDVERTNGGIQYTLYRKN